LPSLVSIQVWPYAFLSIYIIININIEEDVRHAKSIPVDIRGVRRYGDIVPTR
jgi:hypothetical protein